MSETSSVAAPKPWARRSFFASLAALVLTLGVAACGGTVIAPGSGWRVAEVPPEGSQPAIGLRIFSPCDQAAKAPFAPGPFAIDTTPGCPIAGSDKLPLIVMSHGRGGNFHAHHDTATALARAGFLVAALSHPGDESSDLSNSDDISVLYHRPAQVKRVIDFMLSSAAPESARIDAQRIGFFGFSRGGNTGMVLAGATPDFANTNLPCPAGMKICDQITGNQIPDLPLVTDKRIKAMAIADPLSFFPTPESVKNVKIPIQMWGSQLGGDGVTPESVALLAKNMAHNTEFTVIPNTNHYSYLHPCTPALAAIAPEICTQDPAGLDRPAMHLEWNVRMAMFFKQKL
ncbi:MAG: dienelactone hydrolase [Brachymonas sp.]|nr:dienelactone hydrolase [Brachymonas sp.]